MTTSCLSARVPQTVIAGLVNKTRPSFRQGHFLAARADSIWPANAPYCAFRLPVAGLSLLFVDTSLQKSGSLKYVNNSL
jgi:hypothetical protein